VERTLRNGIDTPAAADPFRLDGRVALVTGAGGGIGGACCVALARAGAAVAAVETRSDALAATVAAVEAEGGRIAGRQGDVSDELSVAKAFDAAEAALGPVDVLVNTAFAVEHRKPEEHDLESFRLNLDTTLTGSWLCAREAARRMIARGSGGAVVNISSIAGSSALGRRNFAYSVAKGGIEQMTRELAVEWAKHGIRVNAVAPCQILTPGFRVRMSHPDFDQALMDRILAGIPLNRLGEPEEIARPVVFLASPAASLVTGVILPADGGNLALNAGGSHTY
jgi:NAD(P)-dependent dehydrogenase (short-subunit alcohol dehydrogenase family)